jgi:hypothetical protein
MNRLDVIVAFKDGSRLTYEHATFKTNDGGVIIYQDHMQGEPPFYSAMPTHAFAWDIVTQVHTRTVEEEVK